MPTRRWGSERLVNTTTAGQQWQTNLVTLGNGRMLATWRVAGSSAITGQILDAAGAPLGGELTLRAADAALVQLYDVAALADGGFYLVWTEEVGAVDYILGRVFNADATPVREQPVLYSFGRVDEVGVAGFGAGAVVAWKGIAGESTQYRVFDGAGTGGSLLKVYGGSLLAPSDADVATAPGQANVAIAWVNWTDPHSVFVVLKDATGTQVGGHVEVARSVPGLSQPIDPALAWISPSRIALVWTESFFSPENPFVLSTPNNPADVKLCLLSISGPGSSPWPDSDIITVNATRTGSQYAPQVVALPSGGFVVGWLDGNGYSAMVRVQAFDGGGARVGGETTVNANGMSMSQFRLAALPDGRVAVTWTSESTLDGGSDGDSTSVRLQIIDPRDGIVVGTAAGETLYGHDQVNDEISGYGGNDTLYGLRGDDALWGGAGADLLDGGRGADDMHGGPGNDLYILDNVDDAVFELGMQGNDTVQTGAFGVDLALYLNVENVTLTGALALFATGNVTANILNGEGNSAANVLTGLQANDTYIVGAGDTVVEVVGGGTDTVQSSSISLNLAGYSGVENIVLAGALPLSATGNAGDNVLGGEPNTAANVLTGLGGNDTYDVGTGDTVVEAAGGGTDTVRSATRALDLAQFANVENATLLGALALSATGTAAANVLDGAQNSAANVLAGLGGNDVYILGAGDTVVEAPGGGTDRVESGLVNLDLGAMANVEWLVLRGSLALSGTGTAAADILDGSLAPAANVLTGLGGNDTYVVGAGDTIVEAPGGGTDSVQSWSVSIDLAAFPNVENASITGAMALFLNGSGGANVLNGETNSAANVLTGLAGDDTYILGPGDMAVEAGVGGGTDTVQSGSISLDMATALNFENATLTGSAALNLTGNANANVLTGNAGANVITGNGGGDTFTGLGGTDTLLGGAGADRFRFLAPADSAVGVGRDVIQAFNAVAGDRIDLAAIDPFPAQTGDQAFTWRGTAAFTGAAGELRYDVVGPDVVLQGTVAGGVPSFEIRVAGVGALAAGDLVL